MNNPVYRDDQGSLWIGYGRDVVLVDDAMIRRIAEKIGSLPFDQAVTRYNLKELTDTLRVTT